MWLHENSRKPRLRGPAGHTASPRHTQMEEMGRKPCEDRTKGLKVVVTSQGRLEPLETGRGREDLPLEPPEGVGHWDTLILDFLPLELGANKFLFCFLQGLRCSMHNLFP